MSSNPVHGEVYSIQHYVIKFASDLRQVAVVFSGCPQASSTNTTDNHDITEILLKVALNTITQTQLPPQISLLNFDRTVFEEVIALLEVECEGVGVYFRKKRPFNPVKIFQLHLCKLLFISVFNNLIFHFQYLGDWYEIYKFNAIFENGQACIKANYKLKENGHIRVFNTGNKP